MPTSPTSRSMALLRKTYPLVGKVEQRLPLERFVTRDFAGCIDIIACRPGEIVGVQTTSRPHLSHRKAKSLACPGLRHWLEAGGRFVLHGWAKVGPRGKRKLWECAVEELTLADLGIRLT